MQIIFIYEVRIIMLRTVRDLLGCSEDAALSLASGKHCGPES